MTTPLFIAVEGIDGCGKSTFAQLLHDKLEQENISVAPVVRNPGATALGKETRRILLNESKDSAFAFISPFAEFALFLAGNAQIDYEIIQPNLRGNYWVIVDRWAWSTLVYQIWAGVLDSSLESSIPLFSSIPGICFWLRCEPGVAAARLEQTGKGGDRYEDRGLPFLKKLDKSFYDSKSLVKFNWGWKVETLQSTEAPPEVLVMQAFDIIKSDYLQ